MLENILPNTDKCTFLDLKGVFFGLWEVDPTTGVDSKSHTGGLSNGITRTGRAHFSGLEEHKVRERAVLGESRHSSA